MNQWIELEHMKDLSLHILDIAQNSISANATLVEIEITEDQKSDVLKIMIRDNGCGMGPEMLKKAIDPFFTTRTTRKVGLGLSLLKQNAERSGGKFKISSEEGKGTEVEAVFQYSNIDRPPLGDIAGTIALVASAKESTNVIFKYKTGNQEYIFNTLEVKNILDGIPISDAKVFNFIKEMIKENLVKI